MSKSSGNFEASAEGSPVLKAISEKQSAAMWQLADRILSPSTVLLREAVSAFASAYVSLESRKPDEDFTQVIGAFGNVVASINSLPLIASLGLSTFDSGSEESLVQATIDELNDTTAAFQGTFDAWRTKSYPSLQVVAWLGRDVPPSQLSSAPFFKELYPKVFGDIRTCMLTAFNEQLVAWGGHREVFCRGQP